MFEHDVEAVRDYIAYKLQNPQAAIRLIEDTEKAILKRLDNPVGFEQYHSKKERKYPYYRINIRNYVVFYVVIGDVMEVRRFIYGRRDIDSII
jgi:plasmid stabilization system protein ParE